MGHMPGATWLLALPTGSPVLLVGCDVTSGCERAGGPPRGTGGGGAALASPSAA